MNDFVFVAVSSTANRFEPPLFGRATPENVMGDFLEVIDLAESLVKALDLETRIWTRA